jgi:hypothetical protein
MISARYEYSGQPVGTVNRQWSLIGNSSTMQGNYLVPWTAINPLTDNVDNNGNGLVDEAAEANSDYYIRAIANDQAKNFAMSATEFEIHVDNSAPQMALFQIEQTNLADTHYIYNIDPALTTVALTANYDPAAPFDPPTQAEFSYRYINDIDTTWPAGWTPIGTSPVMGNNASVELGFIQEGYYQFKVIAIDALGNNSETITTVIFNDVTGPEITFTQVGARPVISEKYAFATNPNMFDGNLIAQLSNAANVSAVTFEYSLSGNVWHLGKYRHYRNYPRQWHCNRSLGLSSAACASALLKATAQDTNANNHEL